MNEKFNKIAKVELLTKVVLSHGEEKGLIVKDPSPHHVYRSGALKKKIWGEKSTRNRQKMDSECTICIHFSKNFPGEAPRTPTCGRGYPPPTPSPCGASRRFGYAPRQWTLWIRHWVCSKRYWFSFISPGVHQTIQILWFVHWPLNTFIGYSINSLSSRQSNTEEDSGGPWIWKILGQTRMPQQQQNSKWLF